MDKKGFLMGVTLRCKVICRRNRRTPRLTMDGSCEWVTVIETVSGDGEILSPLIINKEAAHYAGWYAGLKRGDKAVFGISEKGWSNEKLGLQWLYEVFNIETQEK